MSGSRVALAALVLGTLSVAAIPAGMVAADRLAHLTLIRAEEIAVAAGFVLGLIAVSTSRRARYRVERTVRRSGSGLTRFARFISWAGVYFAVTGALALGVYAALAWQR
jgi:hypothetical protein